MTLKWLTPLISIYSLIKKSILCFLYWGLWGSLFFLTKEKVLLFLNWMLFWIGHSNSTFFFQPLCTAEWWALGQRGETVNLDAVIPQPLNPSRSSLSSIVFKNTNLSITCLKHCFPSSIFVLKPDNIRAYKSVIISFYSIF